MQCIQSISLIWVLNVGDSQISTMSDTYQDLPLPPPTYGASRPVYSQYYERLPPVSPFTGYLSDPRIRVLLQDGGVAQVHRTTASTHPAIPSNDLVSSHPGGLAHVAAYGLPSLLENAPATSERGARGATQHFNNTDHNPVVPSIMMTNIYRDLAIQFIRSPQSNIVMMHMASAGISSGRVKVTIELEIDGAV
jgi:hypothetical protein